MDGSIDIVLLPGGHDKAIRQYLESQTLHDHLVRLLPHTKRGPGGRKVLGAICHGVLALAFARCPGAEKSLLAEYGLQTTTLPMWMEATAWVASQAWLMGGYFRTYGASRWCYSDVGSRRSFAGCGWGFLMRDAIGRASGRHIYQGAYEPAVPPPPPPLLRTGKSRD